MNSDIKTVDLEDALQTLELDDYNSLVEDLSYDGFDPFHFLSRILAEHKGKMNELKRHLSVIITIGVHRGFGGSKTIESIASTTHRAGSVQILAAAKFLKLKKKADSKMAVTIGRLLVCFPTIAFKAWNSRPRNRIANDHGLPLEFMYPGSPSMMNEDAWKRYKQPYINWMSEVQVDLWKTTAEDSEKWATLSYQNPCTPHHRRVAPVD